VTEALVLKPKQSAFNALQPLYYTGTPSPVK